MCPWPGHDLSIPTPKWGERGQWQRTHSVEQSHLPKRLARSIVELPVRAIASLADSLCVSYRHAQFHLTSVHGIMYRAAPGQWPQCSPCMQIGLTSMGFFILPVQRALIQPEKLPPSQLHSQGTLALRPRHGELSALEGWHSAPTLSWRAFRLSFEAL